MGVIIYYGFHMSSNTWDGNGDLVGDGSNEPLGIASQRIAAKEEEARQKELQFIADLCDSLRDGGLPSPSSTEEPHHESVSVDLLLDPVHDLLQDGFAGVFVAFRWVTAL